MPAPVRYQGRVGEIVAKRYELVDLIGSGGQSIVYRARDRIDGDVVAIKILGGQDPDAVERMFREALVMSQLMGTAAVRVLHQVHTDDGAFALVMELLEGEDLAVELERREKSGERADKNYIVRVFEPIVRTLEAAHDRGIVHRDVKTENVFVCKGGGVRLLDFGFAKLLRSPKITGAEVVAGSPSYLAPEVWANGSSCADLGVDVYALGVVLFRVLAGELPFRGTTLEVLRDVTTGARPSLHAFRPDFSPDVDGWVQQVLAIKPEDRFQRIGGAWRALVACL